MQLPIDSGSYLNYKVTSILKTESQQIYIYLFLSLVQTNALQRVSWFKHRNNYQSTFLLIVRLFLFCQFKKGQWPFVLCLIEEEKKNKIYYNGLIILTNQAIFSIGNYLHKRPAIIVKARVFFS